MERVVLFAGKEYPDGRDFAIAALRHNRKPIISVAVMPDRFDEGTIPEGMYLALWSRNSPLAARSFLVQAESVYGSLQEVVVVFDTGWYSSHFIEMTPECCTRSIDTMVSSYAYLVTEVLSRFKRKGGGSLIFVIKKSSTGTNGGFSKPVSIFAGMAEGAFRGLGESVALTYAQEEDISIVLSMTDYSTADTHFANWLFEVLDAPNGIAGKMDPKRGPQWFKMGAKTTKVGLFHRPQKK